MCSPIGFVWFISKSTDFLSSFFRLMAPLPKADQPDPVSAEGHINTAGGCVFYITIFTTNAMPSQY